MEFQIGELSEEHQKAKYNGSTHTHKHTHKHTQTHTHTHTHTPNAHKYTKPKRLPVAQAV